ncbi:hypothetical protein CAY60_018025 [Shouchella clausii]|jgi:hypothetical protein|uniref:hypothetical protein n=1 Tax=Shouchella TaxID=2893057 RepID=UPI0004E69F8B|nr:MULTISPECIES: hypothetical protein [Shouchella]ALA55053.1 hypothetical protein DB29_04225 [Shouchella clausii]MBU3231026.1 hypothetical protein [Shouchella clausii]MBU3262899.1 hypothetical protein [Shouchella clausii]MBU3505363.1 hypothetical protein [Shouchella clausii]MBU3534929.1 hypothetical protein [Shouchella clausii]
MKSKAEILVDVLAITKDEPSYFDEVYKELKRELAFGETSRPLPKREDERRLLQEQIHMLEQKAAPRPFK